MSDFDPYYKWLGIRPEEQPAHHYRLRGIVAFETDADVIDTAAEQRTVYLRTCATGEYVAHSQRLLNEVAVARLCLLNPQKKAAYDAELKAKLAPPSPKPTPSPAAPAPTKAPTAVAPPATKGSSEPDPLDGFDAADELGAALWALQHAPAAGRARHGGTDKGGAAGRAGATGRKKSRGNGPPRTVLVGGGIALLAVVGLVGGLFVFGGFGRSKPSPGKNPTHDELTVAETRRNEPRSQPLASTRAPSQPESTSLDRVKIGEQLTEIGKSDAGRVVPVAAETSLAEEIASRLRSATDWIHIYRGTKVRYVLKDGTNISLPAQRRTGTYRIDGESARVVFVWDNRDNDRKPEGLVYDRVKKSFVHFVGGAFFPAGSQTP